MARRGMKKQEVKEAVSDVLIKLKKEINTIFTRNFYIIPDDTTTKDILKLIKNQIDYTFRVELEEHTTDKRGEQ